jgi:hypothetical protein
VIFLSLFFSSHRTTRDWLIWQVRLPSAHIMRQNQADGDVMAPVAVSNQYLTAVSSRLKESAVICDTGYWNCLWQALCNILLLRDAKISPNCALKFVWCSCNHHWITYSYTHTTVTLSISSIGSWSAQGLRQCLNTVSVIILHLLSTIFAISLLVCEIHSEATIYSALLRSLTVYYNYRRKQNQCVFKTYNYGIWFKSVQLVYSVSWINLKYQ